MTGIPEHRQQVIIKGSTDEEVTILSQGGDNKSNTHNGLVASARSYLFNSESWDRKRGNTELTLLASGARNSTTTSSEMTNHNARGIILVLDVTDISPSGTDSLNIKLQGKIGGETWKILANISAIAAVTTKTIICYPASGQTEEGEIDLVEPYPLPRTYRIQIVHSGNTDTFTYSVKGSLIV